MSLESTMGGKKGLRARCVRIATIAAIALGITGLLLPALGCGRKESAPAKTPAGEMAPKTTPPQPAAGKTASPLTMPEKGSREVTLKDEKGKETTAELSSGELPKGYPADLPSPPQSTPAQSLLIPGHGGLVTFVSKASRQDVIDHFKKSLPEQGWTIDSTTEHASQTLIKASKGARHANVSIEESSKGVEVGIALAGS